MPVSKFRRFEIFKRDGFTCQYCGQRPPEVVLELDHIEPRALGGGDDELNLTTSCADCNRGKSARRLGDIHPRPDADVRYLEVQQEVVEAQRYLESKALRDEMMAAVVEELSLVMRESFHWGGGPQPHYLRSLLDYLRSLLVEFGPEEVEAAVRLTGPRYRQGLLKDDTTAGIFRYLRGVMQNRRE